MHYLRGFVSVLALVSSLYIESSCAVPDLWVLYEDYPSAFEWRRSNREEVEKVCAPHLSDVSSSFVINKWELQQQLSFSLGDWQQSSRTPNFIIPFLPHRPHSAPIHLSSLHITELEMNYHRPINYVKADLHLLITSGNAHWKQQGPDFQVQPGFTSLKIALEGFYVKLTSGKRVLCMLGSALLPVHGANASAPWESVKNNNEFTQMLAVFHFPDFPSLTTRAVIGKLSSLHAPSHPSYFSSINIFAQLGASAGYQFVSNDLVASACSPSQQPPTTMELPSNFLNGGYGSLCKLTQELFVNPWTLMPNPNCQLSPDVCSKLGPFSFNISSSTLMGGGFDGVQISLQHVQCEETKEKDGSYSANVSAVFRALLPSENRSLASLRSGVDGMTLAAEGKWSSLSSTFCMVGCRGGYPSTDPSKEEARGSMVSIMFAWCVLSLRQRSLLRGSISSVLSNSNQLSFYQPVFPSLLPSGLLEKLAYNYTQITYAKDLSEAYKKFRYGEKIKNLVLTYPCADRELSDLFDYLTIPAASVRLQSSAEPSAEPLDWKSVKIQIVALEDLVGLDREQRIESASANVDGGRADEHKPYYRVAATLAVERTRSHLELNDDVFSVSVEGVYDSVTGRMSMIGCRVVSATWAMLQAAAGLLEDGLDCNILVRIEYPPMIGIQLLINPTLKVSIMSNRTQDDPFFFPAIDLETIPITYRMQRGDFMSHRSTEGRLSVLLILSLMLGCVAGQLTHMKRNADSTPYISTFMLAIHAVGLSLFLITDLGAVFGSNAKGARVMNFRVLQYVIKLLSLVAFFLTLRIMQKVIASRSFLGTRLPPKSLTIPSEKKVMALCTAVYGIVLCINFINTNQQYSDDHWETVLLKFYGVVHDLFLLPQVVGNHLWQVKGKPLRMFFYVGITVLRLLPNAYYDGGYVWPEYGYATRWFDPYSRATDVAIVPVLAVLLAIVVYFQQRNYRLRWDTVVLKTYKRLPP